MPEINDLLMQASALGEALAAHPLVQEYHAAQRAVKDDPAAQQLLRDFQSQAARIRQLEIDQKPVEVADKQKLRELEMQMAGNESLKKLMRTQADYVGLMNKVNQSIDAPLAALHQPEKPA